MALSGLDALWIGTRATATKVSAPFHVISINASIPSTMAIEELDGGFKIVDSNGQSLAFVYGHLDPRDAVTANGLTLDEARRIASNIAKLPALLTKSSAPS